MMTASSILDFHLELFGIWSLGFGFPVRDLGFRARPRRKRFLWFFRSAVARFRGTRNYEPKQGPVDLYHSPDHWRLDRFSQREEQSFADHVGGVCCGAEFVRRRYYLQELCGRHFNGIVAGGL